jgi:hypothetical protein
LFNKTKIALLDQPLIQTNKRERKATQHFTIPLDKKSKIEQEINAGRGIELGEISIINKMINKYKCEDLKLLSHVCFNHRYKKTEIKKKLRQFKGFSFNADSVEFKKKQNYLENKTKAEIKVACKLLALAHQSLNKKELIECLLNYLLEPTQIEEEKSEQTVNEPIPQSNSGSDLSFESEDETFHPFFGFQFNRQNDTTDSSDSDNDTDCDCQTESINKQKETINTNLFLNNNTSTPTPNLSILNSEETSTKLNVIDLNTLNSIIKNQSNNISIRADNDNDENHLLNISSIEKKDQTNN